MILNKLPNKLVVFLAIKRWAKKNGITSDDEVLKKMTFLDFMSNDIVFDVWGESLHEIKNEINKLKTIHKKRFGVKIKNLC